MELKITALTPEALASILSRSGAKITSDAILADVSAGAPSNPDGTINLIHYTAWMLKELSQRGV